MTKIIENRSLRRCHDSFHNYNRFYAVQIILAMDLFYVNAVMSQKVVYAGEIAANQNVEKAAVLNVLNWKKDKEKEWNNKKVDKNASTPDIIHKMC